MTLDMVLKVMEALAKGGVRGGSAVNGIISDQLCGLEKCQALPVYNGETV